MHFTHLTTIFLPLKNNSLTTHCTNLITDFYYVTNEKEAAILVVLVDLQVAVRLARGTFSIKLHLHTNHYG